MKYLFFVWNFSDFIHLHPKNAKNTFCYLASECDSRLGYSDYSFLAVFLLKNALIFEWHAAFFDSRCLLASSGPLPPDCCQYSFHKRIFSTSLALRCVFFFAFPIHKTFDRHLSSWFVPLGHFIWLSLRSSIAWSISMLNKLYLIFKLRSLMSLIMCLDSWAWCQAKIHEMAHYYSCLKALFICLVWSSNM